MATFTADVDITVEEFLDELYANEKEELYESLKDEFEDDVRRMDREKVLIYLRGLTPYDFKKLLIDALFLPSYFDGAALERALKPIIDAQ